MAVRPNKKRQFVSVDFTGVESGGMAIPDGEYIAEATEISEEESSEGKAYLAWKYRVVEGPSKGGVIYDNTSLQPQSLWRLKGLLTAMGIDVPDGPAKLDLGEYIGRRLQLQITNENYQGKEKPRVTGFSPIASAKTTTVDDDADDDDDDDDSDADEAPPPKSVRRKKSAAPSFEVGDKVKFDNDGEVVKGKIVSITGDVASLRTTSGDEWEVEFSELTAA